MQGLLKLGVFNDTRNFQSKQREPTGFDEELNFDYQWRDRDCSIRQFVRFNSRLPIFLFILQAASLPIIPDRLRAHQVPVQQAVLKDASS
jgi:hypothetical protein